ncbi:nitrate- and nitrite sensing domain-containing protein, partial [Enterobacter hormaechei]
MTIVAGSSPGATEWFQRARMLREEQLGRLAQLGALVNGISRLVHMLQCERGASNVWLCSQGKLYGPECKASRALVDENLAALHLLFNEPLPGSALCERIASALHGLETL